MTTITARKRSYNLKTRLHLAQAERALVSSGMSVELFRKSLRQGKIALDAKYKPYVDILAKKKEKSLRMKSSKPPGRAASAVETAVGDLMSVYEQRLNIAKLSSDSAQEVDRLKQNVTRLKSIIRRSEVTLCQRSISE